MSQPQALSDLSDGRYGRSAISVCLGPFEQPHGTFGKCDRVGEKPFGPSDLGNILSSSHSLGDAVAVPVNCGPAPEPAITRYFSHWCALDKLSVDLSRSGWSQTEQ